MCSYRHIVTSQHLHADERSVFVGPFYETTSSSAWRIKEAGQVKHLMLTDTHQSTCITPDLFLMHFTSSVSSCVNESGCRARWATKGGARREGGSAVRWTTWWTGRTRLLPLARGRLKHVFDTKKTWFCSYFHVFLHWLSAHVQDGVGCLQLWHNRCLLQPRTCQVAGVGEDICRHQEWVLLREWVRVVQV